jgi:hypothetical protein
LHFTSSLFVLIFLCVLLFRLSALRAPAKGPLRIDLYHAVRRNHRFDLRRPLHNSSFVIGPAAAFVASWLSCRWAGCFRNERSRGLVADRFKTFV